MLKEKLTFKEYDKLRNELLEYIHRSRKGQDIDKTAASNLTDLLMDVDEYKIVFEKQLIKSTVEYYGRMADQRIEEIVRL